MSHSIHQTMNQSLNQTNNQTNNQSLSHPLKSSYKLWLLDRDQSINQSNNESYAQSMKQVCQFSTIEEFWHCYQYIMLDPSSNQSINQSNNQTNNQAIMQPSLHLFRSPIAPLWEDPANTRGGRWQIRVKKTWSPRVWESLCLAMIGDTFGLGDELCGIVLTPKSTEDLIGVWNRSANDSDAVLRVKQMICESVGMDQAVNQAMLEYRPHDQSIKAVNQRT